jgi:hypothetical protein
VTFGSDDRAAVGPQCRKSASWEEFMGIRRTAGIRTRVVAVAVSTVLVLVTAGCGDDSGEAAATEAPTTTTTTSTTTTTTTTTTTVPTTGIITGRVYLMDRDEPIETTVELLREEDKETIDTTQTDGDGRYSFSIADEGTYTVRVSLGSYAEMCDNLRREPGDGPELWPVVVRQLDGGGTTDILAGSVPTAVTIGDEITLDLELYCD